MRRVKNPVTGQMVVQDFFTNIASVDSLAAGASQSVNVNIDADSEFVLLKMAYFADIAGAAQTEGTQVVPLVTVELVDSGSGRYLQSAPVPIDSTAGRGELPFVLPVPRSFSPNSTIRVTFTNYSNATTYTNLKLAMIGYKEFKV